MKIIIGLGNPGNKYENTRHNIGFLVIDELAKKANADLRAKKTLNAQIVETGINDKNVILCKPQTFMNNSGQAVYAILEKTSASASDIIVINDDADLLFGDMRIKKSGSSAGHNGIQSIIEHLGTDNFTRIRLGIGRSSDQQTPLDKWVLQKWTKEEKIKLPEIIGIAIDAIKKLL
ncbi:MAG: aminoacyl-tRNA hydrolase [Patescibacteria group bacterium]